MVGEAAAVVADAGAGSFDDYVATRSASLLRFAYLVTRNTEDAHDAVQDALIGLYPRWQQIAARGEVDAYVRRSIVNAHVSAWRKVRRLFPVEDTSVLTASPVVPDASAGRRRRRPGPAAVRRTAADATRSGRAAVLRGPVVRGDRTDPRVPGGHRTIPCAPGTAGVTRETGRRRGMSEDFDREERAFAEALRKRRAGGVVPSAGCGSHQGCSPPRAVGPPPLAQGHGRGCRCRRCRRHRGCNAAADGRVCAGRRRVPHPTVTPPAEPSLKPRTTARRRPPSPRPVPPPAIGRRSPPRRSRHA